ncbi:hypothetical protein U6A24_13480 [Aquimarina gracilis]|uniref:Uncharacterized protein n=1 Tax=Aquimarina gracilis TaxID=874422 RepID=A0ABU5ZXA7_9FLAO|nr:hypothetical protein [Aquimarina gracilis]MEB3346483.1 hypothetical protein [Aquimarina gracilis]
MNYIFCSKHDQSAIWLYQVLKDQFDALEIVTEDMLWYNKSLRLKISSNASHFDIRLHNGIQINSDTTNMVINRFTRLPADHFMYVENNDKEYAQSESNAVLVSLLNTIKGEVYNPATANCLYGTLKHPQQWLKMVAQQGGNTITYPFEKALSYQYVSEIKVLVMFGQMVFCNVNIPEDVKSLCLKLSQKSNNPIIEFTFLQDKIGAMHFSTANLLPNFKEYISRENATNIATFIHQLVAA